jgi:hypothetical protein
LGGGIKDNFGGLSIFCNWTSKMDYSGVEKNCLNSTPTPPNDATI